MIDLLPNEDQQAVVSGLADYLRDAMPLDRFRLGKISDVSRWIELAELGCFGVLLPEAVGGMGLSIVEAALAFREYGRHMLPPAVLGSTLAAQVAARAGAHDLAADLVGGKRRAGLVVAPADGAVLLADVLDDDFCVLVDGAGAHVFEPAAIEGREALHSLDETISLTRARIAGAPFASTNDAAVALSAPLLAAASLCGLLEASRDMAAAYAGARVQFGKPIGVFQGVKHRCADMALWGEAAWSQTGYAALMLRDDAPDAEFHVRAAKMVAGESSLSVARANIQIHGGMGFTAEIDAQLLLKRSHLMHQMFGDPRAIPRALLDLQLVA
jgi:alkylation response protein AidB-like acyl-CoA dehydrogenase